MITDARQLRLSVEDTSTFNEIVEIRRQLRCANNQINEIQSRIFTVLERHSLESAEGELREFRRDAAELEDRLIKLYDLLFREE